MDSTIVADDMRQKLLTLDTVREKLSATEPLSSHHLEPEKTHFVLKSDWAHALESKVGIEPVDAWISITSNGTSHDYQLTKDAIQAATSVCGLNTAYVSRTPSSLIEPQLNYWFREGFQHQKKAFKLLAIGGAVGAAITKETINPFSNLRLLEETLDGIEKQYGTKDVLVDYKFQHSLRKTVMRLVVPEKNRMLKNTGTQDDLWSTGIQIKNSLTGEGQTEINGYLFRWWCTNGCTDTATESGIWSRRSASTGDDVYEWARTSVDDILGGLEGSLDAVQSLTDIPIEGEANEVLKDVFTQYRVPQATRDRILANMVEASELTMYSLLNAVTQVANGDDIDPKHASSLMSIGGELSHRAHERCNGCHRLLDV